MSKDAVGGGRQEAPDRNLGTFKPIRMRKAAEEVTSVIIDAIHGGVFEPGDRLPRERDLAERLEVSRVTVREAIRLLESAGIVSVRRGNQGGVVVESRWIPARLIAAVEGESHSNLRTLFETRRVLETTAAVLAAGRADDDHLAELERLVDLLPELIDDPDEFIAVDFQFHIKVADACGNPTLAAFTTETIQQFAALRQQYPIGRADLRRGLANQRDTLEALRSRDPERIVASLDEHLGVVEEHFIAERIVIPGMFAGRGS